MEVAVITRGCPILADVKVGCSNPSDLNFKNCPLGAQMEDLIELVAASFARHGIDCRPTDPQLSTARNLTAVDSRAQEVVAALPEHNYRKIVQGDPSP